ncbi:4-coumarate--CoA ligase [Cognatiyoonia koreensis]|uniref:4-coumarate--CoA ligase n=1 Tax=Cognatiyoonia koreensis TaxID=364200 RepID=A0A1I0QIK8_9RHOB|nr:AMP-binding protein [Cognatiyoonia koreensis]SEW26928.1 4-coumarate--CoA ligase [Cognatiyoonia koreensis]
MHVFNSIYPDVPLRDVTMTEQVFESLRKRPDDIVLTDGPSGKSMTAAAFIDQVQRLAGGLAQQGFGKGDVLAILAPNMPDFCVVFHAITYAGGTITTLNPSYTAPEITHQLKDSGAKALFTVPALCNAAEAAISGTSVEDLFVVGEDSYTDLFGTALTAQISVDLDHDTVVLPYSSGTTGLPKGVMLSHRNMVVNVDQSISALDFQPGEVTAAFLPFFHIYGLNVLMNTHLTGGGGLVTMPRFDLEMFLRISQDHKARRMWIAPPVALALAKHPMVDDYDLSALELVFCAAAPLGAALSEAVADRLKCRCVQGYGMTELAPVSHAVPVGTTRHGAAGISAPNTLCRIVDIETGDDLGADGEGELWIKGPQVMLGYLNNPTSTAETITQDGWLRTGDIAKIGADGFMTITDRLKELIKYKGFQVAPAELEAVLVGMDGVTDAAVIGSPDPEAGELPIAYIVATEDGPSDAAIRAHFSDNLASYKQLHRIERVSEIPKSASGKILRRLLRDQLVQQSH